MIVVWIIGAGEGSALDAIKAAGMTWLVAHLVPVSASNTLITLLPIGFVVVPGFLLWRAGTWAARRSGAVYWRDVRTTVVMASAIYATIAMIVAGFSSMNVASISPLLALVVCFSFCFVVFGGSAARTAGLWPRAYARLTRAVRDRLKCAGIALLVVGSGSAFLLSLSLALRFSEANGLQELLGVGFFGFIGLLILSLAYFPNLIIWASSYTTGVGFSAGGGGVVSPFGAEVGAMPAFPLLAAVPTTSAWYTLIPMVVPLIGGVVATFYARKIKSNQLAREVADLKVTQSSVEQFTLGIRDRLWISGLVGVAMVFLSFIAGGSLGQERMAGLGPSPLGAGFAMAVMVLFGTVIGSGLMQFSQWRGSNK